MQESWNYSDKEYCFKLVKSMPERTKGVIKAQGEVAKSQFYFFFL